MNLSNLTSRQKVIFSILLVGIIALCVILIIFIYNQKNINVKPPVSSPVISEEPVSSTVTTPIDNSKIDLSKYPNPDFPAVKSSQVFSINRTTTPRAYTSDTKIFIECGNIEIDTLGGDELKDKCIARDINNGDLISITHSYGGDYFKIGSVVNDHQEYIIFNLSEGGGGLWSVYIYNYETRSATFVDKLTFLDGFNFADMGTDPAAFLLRCDAKLIANYDKADCYLPYKETETGKNNIYFIQNKDKYGISN